MKKFSKEEKSWALYDWGSSAYSIIITTAVFPIYYKASATEAGVSLSDSTAYLGYTIAIFTFIFAMIGPILGTIAEDRKSTRLNSSHVKTSYAVFSLI